jgi:hypothetical protein
MLLMGNSGLSIIAASHSALVATGKDHCTLYYEICSVRPKRDEVTGGWKKLHKEELHNLYSSPSIIRMIKSWRMRWIGHVAQMREMRNAYRKGRDNWEDQGVDGWTIVKWILEREDGMGWIGLIWLRIGTSGGLL